MRNRLYITSLYKGSDIGKNDKDGLTIKNVTKWSGEIAKNVIIFVPSLKSIFLNGKKYLSINEIKNDISVKSVFELSIEDKTNLINLKQTNQNSIIDVFNMFMSCISQDIRENGQLVGYRIKMFVGERIQIFPMVNKKYKFISTCPNDISIDGNYIIHVIKNTDASERRINIYDINGTKVFYLEIEIITENLTRDYDDRLITNQILETVDNANDYGGVMTMYHNIVNFKQNDQHLMDFIKEELYDRVETQAIKNNEASGSTIHD